MTEALKDQKLNAYCDLVEHFRNMSILAFDDSDFDNLERIDILRADFKRHVDKNVKGVLDNSQIYRIEDVSYINSSTRDLKIFIDYKFSSVIERICIAALRKTVLRDQIPEAQSGITYKTERDIRSTARAVNCVLLENEINVMDVKE